MSEYPPICLAMTIVPFAFHPELLERLTPKPGPEITAMAMTCVREKGHHAMHACGDFHWVGPEQKEAKR